MELHTRTKWSPIATLLRKFGNLSIQEILVIMSAYNLPSLQMLGEGEGSQESARLEGDMLYFLGGGGGGREMCNAFVQPAFFYLP